LPTATPRSRSGSIRARPPILKKGELLPLNVPHPGSVDMAWVRERTTTKKANAPL
jgi:hypothetical protein